MILQASTREDSEKTAREVIVPIDSLKLAVHDKKLNETQEQRAQVLLLLYILKQIRAKKLRLDNDGTDIDQVLLLWIADGSMTTAKLGSEGMLAGSPIIAGGINLFAVFALAATLIQLIRGGLFALESSEERTKILKGQLDILEKSGNSKQELTQEAPKPSDDPRAKETQSFDEKLSTLIKELEQKLIQPQTQTQTQEEKLSDEELLKRYIIEYYKKDNIDKDVCKAYDKILWKLIIEGEERKNYLRGEIFNQKNKALIFGKFQIGLGIAGMGSLLTGVGLCLAKVIEAAVVITIVGYIVLAISALLSLSLMYSVGWFYHKYNDAQKHLKIFEEKNAAALAPLDEAIQTRKALIKILTVQLKLAGEENKSSIRQVIETLKKEISTINKSDLKIQQACLQRRVDTRRNKLFMMMGICAISLLAVGASIAFLLTGALPFAIVAVSLVGLTLLGMRAYYSYNKTQKVNLFKAAEDASPSHKESVPKEKPSLLTRAWSWARAEDLKSQTNTPDAPPPNGLTAQPFSN